MAKDIQPNSSSRVQQQIRVIGDGDCRAAFIPPVKINQLNDWTTSAALDSMSQPHFALSANPGNYEKHTRTQDHPITHTHTVILTHTHAVTYRVQWWSGSWGPVRHQETQFWRDEVHCKPVYLIWAGLQFDPYICVLLLYIFSHHYFALFVLVARVQN